MEACTIGEPEVGFDRLCLRFWRVHEMTFRGLVARARIGKPAAGQQAARAHSGEIHEVLDHGDDARYAPTVGHGAAINRNIPRSPRRHRESMQPRTRQSACVQRTTSEQAIRNR